MKFFKLYLYLVLTVGIVACKTSAQKPKSTVVSADFSRYIAVGNSLTAGYADGGLYLEGQQNSYPAIIAKQMLTVGGGSFTQPVFSADQANGSGYLMITGFDANGLPITKPVNTNLAITGVTSLPGLGNITTYTKYTGTDLNNYGVPGIKLMNITQENYGNLNGFYERLLPGSEGTHITIYLDFISAKPFTFFSNWLGNNDALGYATSGGAGDILTDKAVFASLYTQLIARLTASGQKGVVATIPDVTAIPYFNTITTGLVLANLQKANSSVKTIYINAKTTADADNAYATRVATANDLFMLNFPAGKIGVLVSSSAGMQPYGLTPYTPIENQYVLDNNEVAITRDYINAYNNTIVSVATAKGLAVNDMYAFLSDAKTNGIVSDGITLTTLYITGGLFSVDGVHLTQRGYAAVANQFIKAINKQYNTGISLANVAAYKGIKLP